MKIARFALGIRFNFYSKPITAQAVKELLSELSHVVSGKTAAGLHVYGGASKIFQTDAEGVYTILIMNGSLKQMRRLFRAVNNDARLRAMMERRAPYIQNNVVRDFKDMDFFGRVDGEGKLIDGTSAVQTDGIVFGTPDKDRKPQAAARQIIIVPDSFKGTFSATHVTDILSEVVLDAIPTADICPLPAADGGEGTLDAVERAVLCRRRPMLLTNAIGEKTEASYLVIDGSKAIIESAQAVGLGKIAPDNRDIRHATSYGVGEMILHAASEGVKQIYIGLGGTATNDCGIGMAAALGFKLLDAEGNAVTSAECMKDIVTINASEVPKCVMEAHYTVMCDVVNPLCGENGATYVYGPQKGADAETLATLEDGMLNMERLLEEYSGKQIGNMCGAGAAGGMGAMLFALLSAEYASGAEAILDIIDFNGRIGSASAVITGEGRLDSTSANGKLVGMVLKRACGANVPALILAGCRGDGAEEIEQLSSKTIYCSDANNDELEGCDEKLKEGARLTAETLKDMLG